MAKLAEQNALTVTIPKPQRFQIHEAALLLVPSFL